MKTKISFFVFLLTGSVSAQEKPDLNDPQTIENAKTLVSMFDKIDSALAYKTKADSLQNEKLLEIFRKGDKKMLENYVQSDSIYISVLRPHLVYMTINDPLQIYKDKKTFIKELFFFIHENIGDKYVMTRSYYSNLGNIYPDYGITIQFRIENSESEKMDIILNMDSEFKIYGAVIEIYY